MSRFPAGIRTLLCLSLLVLCLGFRPAEAAGGSGSSTVTLPEWQIAVLDHIGDVGYFTSMAIDAHGGVHISYINNTAKALSYATNASGEWQIVEVGPVTGINPTSIGVDSRGKVYIAYEGSSIAIRDLDGNWTKTSANFHYPLVGGVSLAIDRHDLVHVASPTRQNQQYGPDTYRMEYSNNSSGSFKVAKYLPTCMSGAITLRSPSIAMDANDNIYVTFNVSDNLVNATNKTGEWVCNYVAFGGSQPVYYSNRYNAVKSSGQLVVADIAGTEFMALALDSRDKAHIVGLQNNCLRYFTDSSGSQDSAYVDCTSTKVGEYGSIAADLHGDIHVAYFDRTNGDLKYATTASKTIPYKLHLPLLTN